MKAEGWKLATLSEVADLYQGYGFPKHLQGREEGDLGFYKVSDISRAVAAGSEVLGPAAHCISHQEAAGLRAIPLPKGSIVFARIGEAIRLNRRALIPTDALIDNNVIGVKARAGIADRYLYYFLKTVKLGEISQATTVPAVRTSDIAAIEVPVAPSNEQLRIVSKLDELFSRIDEGERALERLQKLVERYRQSVLKAAVTGELTREWREKNKNKPESGEALLARILKARREAWEKSELAKMKAKGITPADDNWKQRYQEPVCPETSSLPDLPVGWVWASVDQLCIEFGNGLSRKPASVPPGEPILRISAVRPLAVDTSDIRFYVPESGESIDGFYARRGDLLFTRYNGSRDLVGVSGVLKSIDRILHPDKLIKARLAAPELAGSEYTAIALNAGASWRHISSCVKTSAGQHGIAGSDIKRAPVPLPPAEEQLKIVDAFTEADGKCGEARASCARELRRSGAARQAILKAAFEGRLVHQNPSDESAAGLLQCIAAERDTGNAAPKRGRKKRITT